jgi:hypothetical protein
MTEDQLEQAEMLQDIRDYDSVKMAIEQWQRRAYSQ